MFQIHDLQGSRAAQEPAPRHLQGVLAWPAASVWETEVHKNSSLDQITAATSSKRSVQ